MQMTFDNYDQELKKNRRIKKNHRESTVIPILIVCYIVVEMVRIPPSFEYNALAKLINQCKTQY